MKNSFLLLIILVFVYSCNYRSDKEVKALERKHENEVQLKIRELELKEKELALKSRELEEKIEQEKKKEEQKPKSLSELYSEVKKGVYLIYTTKEKGRAQGSAFIIDPSGILISNYHVFDKASDAIVYNGENQKYMISEIISYSKEKDFIIFRIKSGLEDLPYLEISELLPEIGENCFAIGNPEGLRQTLSTGIVSSYRKERELIQTTAEITFGSSGGPLFNSKGKVIGITSSGLGQANLNFAINIKELPLDNLNSKNKLNDRKNLIIPKKNSSNHVESVGVKNDNLDIKRIINSYYDALLNNKFNALNAIYSEKMKRFFSLFNVSKEEAINGARSYDKIFGVISKETNVRWETLVVKQSGNSSYFVDFTMDYRLVRKNKSKPSKFVLDIIMEIDSEGKVCSIYENIIEKK